MNSRIHTMHNCLRHFPLFILLLAMLAPSSVPTKAEVIEVIVEDPQLHPTFTTCPESYWYAFDNNREHTAFLTLNVKNPANSANYGEWHPTIPQAGYYQVSAYIPSHDPVTWCTGEKPTIQYDTTEAHYSIHHAYGASTMVISQYPMSNQWLDLGEYYFTAGGSGYVSLADLNTEPDFSRMVSFSALRFTYTRSIRPSTYLPEIRYRNPNAPLPTNVGIIQAHGFDSCHLPEVSEMHTWWHQSPYSFYALYLGGVQLASLCTIANASWVSQVHQQGWSFVPTWVGPQAPCTTYPHKISSDPLVSYQQGRQEAQAASTAAVAMGLTSSGLGGTIIYYDLEAYGYSSAACRQPVSAFMNGWVERLHELGNLAGGYGTRNSYVTDWASIPNIPDDVWPAYWYANNYDPYASVYGIPWIQGLWINHQRIRQYAGDHTEHWGGVGLPVDSDVADGMVALPPSIPLEAPTLIPSASIDDAGWLSADQGWFIFSGQLYWTNDRGEIWQDISPGAVQRAYFTSGGQAWAISIPMQEGASLYHSADGGMTWESMPMTLPTDDWRTIQLEFTSPDTGWLVLKKLTSQAFNIGLLMKTDDGGGSWQSYALPSAASIEFDTFKAGWLTMDAGDRLLQSTDGGLSWQLAQPNQKLRSLQTLPVGTTLSGWQTSDLGWAVTADGTCQGERSTPGFTCQIKNTLWQTNDGGKVWEEIPIPAIDVPKQ